MNENFGVLFAFEPKALIPRAESSMQPGDIGLEEEVEKTTNDRTSNLGWQVKFKLVSSFAIALLTQIFRESLSPCLKKRVLKESC